MTDDTFSAANWLRAIRATEGQGPLALARSLVFDAGPTAEAATTPQRSHLRLVINNSSTASPKEAQS